MTESPQDLLEYYQLARNVRWRYRLDQYEDETIAQMLKTVDVARREIEDAFEGQGLSDWGADRNEAVLAELESLSASLRSNIGAQIADSAAFAGEYSATEHSEILSIGGKATAVNNVELSAEQFGQYFTGYGVGGALLAEWVDRAFDSSVMQSMRDGLNAGLLRGEGYPKMVKRLMDGGFDLLKHEAITISRTYVQTANVAAQMAVYEANKGILNGWKWSSVLEPGYMATGRGTCIRCSSLDGRIFEIGKGPQIPLHPRCRCIARPVTKSWKDLGAKSEDIEEAVRPFTIRPDKNIDSGGKRTLIEVGQHQGDYASWFEKQGRDFKLNVVGPNRLKLLESGKVKFADLVDEAGRTRTLDELMGMTGGGGKAGGSGVMAGAMDNPRRSPWKGDA